MAIVVRARSVSAGRSDLLGLPAVHRDWRARHRDEYEVLGLVVAMLVALLALAVLLGTPSF